MVGNSGGNKLRRGYSGVMKLKGGYSRVVSRAECGDSQKAPLGCKYITLLSSSTAIDANADHYHMPRPRRSSATVEKSPSLPPSPLRPKPLILPPFHRAADAANTKPQLLHAAPAFRP